MFILYHSIQFSNNCYKVEGEHAYINRKEFRTREEALNWLNKNCTVKELFNNNTTFFITKWYKNNDLFKFKRDFFEIIEEV